LSDVRLIAELPVEGDVLSRVLEPLRLEALSPPPGGEVHFLEGQGTIVLELSSDEASTARAMWNSYMGLISAALRTAK
jgi:tRNA threonylcarbamoyladenosine modification (KEOPS) complex  Pcc1 subunit